MNLQKNVDIQKGDCSLFNRKDQLNNKCYLLMPFKWTGLILLIRKVVSLKIKTINFLGNLKEKLNKMMINCVGIILWRYYLPKM